MRSRSQRKRNEPKLLEEGDIIELQNGQVIYSDIPEKFVYQNTPASNEKTHSEVQIGRVYKASVDFSEPTKEIIKEICEAFNDRGFSMTKIKASNFVKDVINKHPKKNMSFVIPEGRFIVYKTSYEGGGTGHGPHDVYPDGHHVFCMGEKNNKLKVDFYQTGCFTAMIEEIKPIGKAEASWRRVK